MQHSLRSTLVLCAALLAPAALISQTILFQEGFEDAAFASRGWYDNTNQALSTVEHRPGGSRSVEFHFPVGAKTPEIGGALRRRFTETDSVYLSYWVKYSAGWTGSNKPYHPHEFQFVTNLDQQYVGPAYTRLTLYVEQNEGRPLLAIQDGKNIDETQVGRDLTQVTEQRAVAGCNGDSDGHGTGECYQVGTIHYNGKKWDAPVSWFTDTPGPRYKNDWHHVEAFFKLNSIVGGKGIADGAIRYWYDGELVIGHDDVMLRTGQFPEMKIDQLLIAPYIGDGSPVDQTMWVDDLTVATGRVSAPAVPTVTLVAPANGASIPGNGISMLWRKPSSGIIDEYNFQLAVEPTFATPSYESEVFDTTVGFGFLAEGTYWWRVRAHDAFDGWGPYGDAWSFTMHGIAGVGENVEANGGIAMTTAPNPFTGSTLLRFSIPRPGRTTLSVLNEVGHVIATPIDQSLEAGEHVVSIDADGWSAGVYLCRLTTPSGAITRRIVVMDTR